MGGNCCKEDSASHHASTTHSNELQLLEAVPVVDPGAVTARFEGVDPGPPLPIVSYSVTLDRNGKSGGQERLGLDVDYMAERKVLPLIHITGGLAEQWNVDHPEQPICPGDTVVDVNGVARDAPNMLALCKTEKCLTLRFVKNFSYDVLVADLKNLIVNRSCGPLLIRLSWHDAGVFSTGAISGGCPNAAMRFPGEGEAELPANAGLQSVALALLKPISDKYCPDLISHADLWALAANIAIKAMGGPEVFTRFGRVDATSAKGGVTSQVGRLPEGDKDAQHLRDIFYPKGFDDKDIVALSGAHTVGMMHLNRSGFEGKWTSDHLRFDNSYFSDLMTKSYAAETTGRGHTQYRHADGTVMLSTDLALLQDPAFKVHVATYARDKDQFFRDFADAWCRLQEKGCSTLREIL